MIISRSLGKQDDAAHSGRVVDVLDIAWFDVHKRVARLRTRAGEEVGVRLDDDAAQRGLQQNDVVYCDDNKIIVINILPGDCIAVTVSEPRQLARFGYEIGNRHAPLFYGEAENEYLTPAEKPVFALLQKLGFNPTLRSARLLPDRRVGANRGHEHAHEHSHAPGHYHGDHDGHDGHDHQHASAPAREHEHSHRHEHA